MAATRAIRDEAELREIVGLPSDLVVSKIADRLNDLTRQFVERSPFVCVATASADGGLDVSPRGDPQGFVRNRLLRSGGDGRNGLRANWALADHPSGGSDRLLRQKGVIRALAPTTRGQARVASGASVPASCDRA
jgi:hypothetical protein